MTLLTTPSPPSLDQIRALLDTGTAPHVSVFMPTRRPWNQTRENQLTLTRLLGDVEAVLRRQGPSPGAVQGLLDPARALIDDASFWRTTADGLAFYAAGSYASTHPLPFAVPEQQFVDRRFHVRPLLRGLTPDGPFYLLALSQGGVRLYRGSRYAFASVPLENVPTTLDEALQFDEHVRSVTYHTRAAQGATSPGKRAAMYHGHEDAGDKAYVKEGIIRFFQPLDTEVRRLLGQHAAPPPLVLAGVATLRGLYRKVNHYPHLTDTDVNGHFVDRSSGTFDVDALHDRAWDVVAPRYAAAVAQDRQRLAQFAGTERASKSLHAIVAAAYAHRIDTLFVSAKGQAWGRYTPDTHTVAVHTDPAPPRHRTAQRRNRVDPKGGRHRPRGGPRGGARPHPDRRPLSVLVVSQAEVVGSRTENAGSKNASSGSNAANRSTLYST
jgi:hypothetical protein